MYYYTESGHPVKLKGAKPLPTWTPMLEKGNMSNKEWRERSKQEYKKICKERNDKLEAEQAIFEEQIQSIQERQKLIMQRALENAEKELIKEGLIKEKV
jgi:hypothetical protein